MTFETIPKKDWRTSHRSFFHSNPMNYDSEILFVLTEAGEKGLSVKKIARHVFNNCNGLFDVVPFEDVYHYVACYLKRNSKSNDSIIERTSIRGVYRLNQSNTSRQLFFDFKSKQIEITNERKTIEDKSLSLF